MGASAGGLEAFEHFFKNMSPNSGAAFVLISHMDPSHASMMTELIQRLTQMPVKEAVDQMPVEYNHIYVIPPNKDLAIFKGLLQLSSAEARGSHMPIDIFLRSLAEDQGERASASFFPAPGRTARRGYGLSREREVSHSFRTLRTRSMTACREAP